ncbi:MAG: hypothetical protein HY094_01080 [Candidatus Melainabacteria bacterium]|nr:hypothetical protein [Candidatus Melainabacteria bacterium]
MNTIKKIITLLLIVNLLNFTFTNSTKALSIVLPKQNQTIFNKNKFSGKWNMQTIVTKSTCPYVFVGSTTKSDLEIKPLLNLNSKKITLKAFWKGGKWSKSRSTIKLLNEKEAITERVTEFITKDKNNWKAILIDHLKLDEDNIMRSESIVIQYKNGLAVGEYKTFSILTKSEESELTE